MSEVRVSDEVSVSPKVSVLMPVYNAGPFIREAVESVLGQTFRDFELLTLDDGSTDDTLSTLRSLARTDSRMRVISRENRGLIETRNQLLREACGELVAWADADDVSYPERLALLVPMFEQEPALQCVGTSRLQIDPEGMPIEVNVAITDRAAIRRAFTVGDGVSFASSLMRRQTVLDVGSFREPFKIGEDFDLVLRLSEVGEIANIDVCLLKYRQHVHSVSRQLRGRWYAIRGLILDLADERRTQGSDRLQRGERVEIPGGETPASLPDACEVHIHWARQAMAAGFRPTARKYALKAIIDRPRALAAWRCALRVALDAAPKLR